MKLLRFAAIAVVALAVIITTISFSGCANRAFYYPTPTVYELPSKYGIAYEDVKFTSRDGTKLTGWFLPARGADGAPNARGAKGTVIHFHGNAQNMTVHWQFVSWLPARGFNVFVFDYRGYGLSEGKPSPRGCFDDSNAAIDYVRSRGDLDPKWLLVFGESLGGNNAIAAVGAGNRDGVRAVVEESTFYSYSFIANQKVMGSGLLMSNAYSASRYIAKISPIPLLIIHGTSDPVVPYENATRLFAAAKEPKKMITIQGGGHIEAMTDAYGTQYKDALVEFFETSLK